MRFLVTWEDSLEEVSPEENGQNLDKEKTDISAGETTWAGECENNNKNRDLNQLFFGSIAAPRCLDNFNPSTCSTPWTGSCVSRVKGVSLPRFPQALGSALARSMSPMKCSTIGAA